jgi:hypothetical protein
VSYALDLETEVAIEEKPPEQVLLALAIRKGGLHARHKVTRRVQYTVKNSSDQAKQVLFERTIDPAWKLVQPAPAETTRALHRLTIQAEPGKPATLAAVEERDATEEFALATLEPSQIELYLRVPAATPALKKALQDAIVRKTAAVTAQANRVALEARLTELSAEQHSVRENLQAVPAIKSDDPADENRNASRVLIKRYLDKLASLETELEKQRQELVTLRQEEHKTKEQLEEYLQGLVLE